MTCRKSTKRHLDKDERQALISLPMMILLGCGIAFVGSAGGLTWFGVPVFGLGVALAFLIQWLAFIPANSLKSEAFFDLVGSATYGALVTLALLTRPAVDTRSILLWAVVMIWAARLGAFLLRRVRERGGDRRFDEIKTSALRFLAAWSLQGLWVSATLAAALAAMTTSSPRPLGLFAWLGVLLWAFGFGVEVASDAQKKRFHAVPENEGKFIRSGLWSWSRHPNYFGEIVLWTGVAVLAAPVLRGPQWVTLLSPVFVAILITLVSGVPALERRAEERWGDLPEYREYKENTPLLILSPPRKAR